MNRPLLIDTDTGVDDALALIVAFRSPEFSIRAVTTVAGNVGVAKCTRNVLKILEVMRLRHPVPVARGAAKPLKRKLVTAPEVHGSEGLGNRVPVLKFPHAQSREKAVTVILDLCQRYPKWLTIVALGPLTNIAAAIRKNASLMKAVRRIVTMGGAFRVPGNTGPVAEFNYYVDPEAAEIVMNSGLPVTVVPLDLTEQVVLMRRDVEYRAHRRPSEVSKFIVRFTRHYMKYHEKAEGFNGGFLHDPLAVAVALDPSLFRFRKMRVIVETKGKWTRGMTIGEFRRTFGAHRPRVDVALRVDKERFLKVFHERLWA